MAVSLESSSGASRGWLQYSALLEGSVAASMLLGTHALVGVVPTPALLVLAFCGTLLVYLADRVLGWAPEDALNQPARRAWLRAHRGYVWTAAAAALAGALLALPHLRAATLLAGVGLLLLAACYVAPVLPQRRRLKAVWFFKPVAIAGAWAGGAVLLPLVEAAAPLTAGAVALVLSRFFFVLANALLADVADRAGDRAAGLHTAATEWAPRRVRRGVVSLLLLAAATGLAALLFLERPWLLCVDLAGPLLLIGLVRRSPSVWRSAYRLGADLVMAWPAVTAVVAWSAGYW